MKYNHDNELKPQLDIKVYILSNNCYANINHYYMTDNHSSENLELRIFMLFHR